MYVAVKGGERAIENAHRLLAHERRGDPSVPELSLSQVSEQLSLAVDRVMSEGSLYDRELAALAIKQARGDMIEAIFLVRAFRATLPRFGATEPVGDLTREPLGFPADRDLRLQNLARADEGFLLALGYSTQRGYGRNHPFAGEIRFGEVEVEFFAEDVGFAVPLGEITVTECQMVNQFKGSATEAPRFTRGYGLAFGQSERKTMSMVLVDRTLRARELGEEVFAPAQDEEFVMSHSDNVQATGFVEHLKLPHYVDFQSELGLLRKLRKEFAGNPEKATATPPMQEAAECTRRPTISPISTSRPSG